MKKIQKLLMVVFLALTTMGYSKSTQDVQVYTTLESGVTTKTIEKGFDANGLTMAGNNDMNKPFSTRFKTLHYKVYNLAMFSNTDLTFKILKKYPSFGALTPLSMSIWQDKDGSMNASTLTINGMSRATGVPVNDPDLIAYAALIKDTLQKALPKGHFKELNHTVKFPTKSFAVNFTADVELDDEATPADFIEDFEAEFEGELEPLGFLLPNYTDVQEEIFDDNAYTGVYDFFHTYSICKFDVIYPVSKLHPEAGAWAPCSFYIYKKVGEEKMHMGFLGVDNWITTLDMSDEASIKPLREAEKMIVDIITEMTE
ncbi:hypothetical protein MNB_SM-4-83 [hydrothermal vent metagenome]|uniref:DUF302 domain-containing protein n=1 Tax=hydrothermal vent metagenome TaxID=652676 RepID=A0A1W1CBH2_9ZZZZ